MKSAALLDTVDVAAAVAPHPPYGSRGSRLLTPELLGSGLLVESESKQRPQNSRQEPHLPLR